MLRQDTCCLFGTLSVPSALFGPSFWGDHRNCLIGVGGASKACLEATVHDAFRTVKVQRSTSGIGRSRGSHSTLLISPNNARFSNLCVKRAAPTSKIHDSSTRYYLELLLALKPDSSSTFRTSKELVLLTVPCLTYTLCIPTTAISP